MKIALGLEYPLKVRGGVGVLVEKLIEGVSGRHEVLLVSPDAPGTKTPGITAHVHWDPSQVSNRTSQALAGKLADLGVSLAHLHLGGNYGWGSRIPRHSPFPYLRQRGIASISTVHMALSILDGYCDPKKSVWFKVALLPITWLGKLDALRNVSAEIVVSRQGCERLRRWYWPFRNKFRAIYHSRLPDALPPVNPSRERLIIAVGHIAFRKGQHTLAAAFAKIAAAHPDWKLALLGPVGDAACMSQIGAIISAHKLQDQILLMGSRDDVADFMRRAAILVQPSLYEGLPLALQEGMYYGCAAVATRVVGNEELILDGTTGLLVPPDNPGALALALDGLMKDPAGRERFGRASAAAIVQKGMTATKMVEQHLALYDRIVTGSGVGVESA